MNNRRIKKKRTDSPPAYSILSKVNFIKKLLSHAIPSMPDSEIFDSKGVRLLTKISNRTLLRRRNNGSLPFYRDKGTIYYLRTDVLKAVLLEKEENLKRKYYEKNVHQSRPVK